MRKIRNSLAILCSASFLMSFALAGCNQKGNGEDVPKGSYAVYFETGGGSSIEKQIVKGGQKASKPAEDPTYEGYIFNGWYAEYEAITEFDFETPITSTTYVYAGWKLDRGSVYPGGNAGDTDNPGPEPGQSCKYTCTNLPSWITDHGCVIFVWAWPHGAEGNWYSANFISGGSALEFTVPQEMEGFLLARCVGGTTTPDWSIKSGNDAGRIYNKTNNINCSSGVFSYACADWVEYPTD